MTVAVYAMETSSITGTGSYELDGAYSPYQGLLEALQVENGESPMPTTWDDVGYTAYTLDADGAYVDVEVGRGTFTNGASLSPVTSPDTLSRSDANVSYSTNSNNRVSWGAGSTIYVAITINAWELNQ